jgi:hypothetical protein
MVEAIGSFALYFVIGVVGACLYLLLQLIVDGNLSVLSNSVIPDMRAMGALYVLAGGVFAAVVQESTGNLFALNSMQTVLLLGFGWQGALSGVGSAQRASSAANKTGTQVKEQSDQNWQDILAMKENQIAAMKQELAKYAKP